MKRLLLFLFSLIPTVSAQFIPEEASRASQAFNAFTRSGKSTTQARELLVQAWNYEGRPVKGDLFVLFDPQTHYYLWMYAENRARPDERHMTGFLTWGASVYITDKALALMYISPPNLQIRESSRKASTIDDAERQAISALNAQANLIGRNGLWPWPPKLVHLPNLDAAFFAPPMSAADGPVKIVSISPTSEGLDVTIEGQWQVKLTLSASYEILNTSSLRPAPVERGAPNLRQ